MKLGNTSCQGGDARPDRVHEGVAEHRNEIVILEDPALDFLGQLFALGGLHRGDILLELGVEILDADRIRDELAAAFEQRLVPIGPARADTGASEDDVDPGPLLQAALPAFWPAPRPGSASCRGCRSPEAEMRRSPRE